MWVFCFYKIKNGQAAMLCNRLTNTESGNKVIRVGGYFFFKSAFMHTKIIKSTRRYHDAGVFDWQHFQLIADLTMGINCDSYLYAPTWSVDRGNLVNVSSVCLSVILSSLDMKRNIMMDILVNYKITKLELCVQQWNC